MKIAFFSLAHISHGGGFEQQIIRYADELNKLGHRAAIISLSKDATVKFATFLSFLYLHPRFSFPEIQNQKKTKFKGQIIEVSSLKQLKSAFRDFDLVYGKNEILDTLILRFAKEKNGPKFICGIHTVIRYVSPVGKYEKIHNLIYSSKAYIGLLSLHRAFHCLNKDDYGFIKSQINGRQIFLVPNFINVSAVVNKNNFFQIIFVGRLTNQKGIDYFIDLVEQINSKSYSLRVNFVICGSGPNVQKVLNLARKYSNVVYKGHVRPEKMGQVYKKTDVIFIPSLGETFSLSCLEAQSFGVVAVAFNVNGIRDIIENEKNGFLVSPGDMISSYEVVSKLIDLKRKRPDQFNKMKDYARVSMQRRFSTSIVLPKFESMFKQILKNK